MMDLEKIKHFFNREVYGLPVWAWSLIVAGGVGLGWYLTKQAGSLFGGGSTGTTTSPLQPTQPAEPLLPPTATPNPVAPVAVTDTSGGGDNGGGGAISAPTNPIQPVASQPSGGLPSPLLNSLFRGVSEGEQSYRASLPTSEKTAVQHSGSTEAPNIASAAGIVANVGARSLFNQNTVAPRVERSTYQSVIGRARAS